MSKPGKVLKGLCKKLGVRLTVKRNGKRVYKSIAVIKRQCANKKKKKVKKKRKVKKKVKRRRKFGNALVGPNNIPPLGDGVTIDNYVYHFDEYDLGYSEDGRRIIERIYTKGLFDNNNQLVSGDTYVYDSYADPVDISDINPFRCYRFKHLKKELQQAEEEIILERIEILHTNTTTNTTNTTTTYNATFNPVFTHFENKIRAAHLGQEHVGQEHVGQEHVGQGRPRTGSRIGKRRKKKET